MALRIVRICNDEQMKEQRLEELKTRLMERKYSKKMIDKELARARETTREEALRRVEKKKEETTRRHKFITVYDPRSSKHVADTLRKNFLAMVETDELCRKIFKDRILVVNKRGQTLREKLTRAKLPGKVDLARERAETVRKFGQQGGEEGEREREDREERREEGNREGEGDLASRDREEENGEEGEGEIDSRDREEDGTRDRDSRCSGDTADHETDREERERGENREGREGGGEGEGEGERGGGGISGRVGLR